MSSSRQPIRPAIIYGTRPEAIKMAPIVRAMHESDHFDPLVIVTGQHRHLLDQVNDLFGIVPDADLEIAQAGQDLTDITHRVLRGMRPLLREHRPNLVIVQGDTTTTFSAALAAFYEQIPVGHVEAGLRTFDPYLPYPEEMNRVLTTRLAAMHFAPSRRSVDNLIAEGIDPASIELTGNTSIDALHWMIERAPRTNAPDIIDRASSHEGPVVLVTAHRRESWHGPIDRIAAAVADIATHRPDALIVVLMHGNPLARTPFIDRLTSFANVALNDSLDYDHLVHLLNASALVLTDSGGLQEEAPSIGKPVLVLRDTTEREEAVEAGTARLVGTDRELITRTALHLLEDGDAYRGMAHATNPYGHGDAAVRILEMIRRLADITPGGASAPAADAAQV